MKKKLMILASALLLASSCASLFLSHNIITSEAKADPADIVNTVRCKCKHDGCYSGNLLSFRSTCRVGSETICNDGAGNCVDKGDSSDESQG